MSATTDKLVKDIRESEIISIGGIRYSVTLVENLDSRVRLTLLLHKKHRFDTSEELLASYSTGLTLPKDLTITVYL